MGHALMENWTGLVVDIEVAHTTGTAERNAARSRRPWRVSSPSDRGGSSVRAGSAFAIAVVGHKDLSLAKRPSPLGGASKRELERCGFFRHCILRGLHNLCVPLVRRVMKYIGQIRP